MPFLYTCPYTKLTEPEPEPESNPDYLDNPYDANEYVNEYNEYAYEEYEYKEYQQNLQRLHCTLASTVTFLTQLLHSFSNDTQNLSYVSERTINQLWTAKVSSFTACQGVSGIGRGIGSGGCLWVQKIRAFLTSHHHHHHHHHDGYNYNTDKKANQYLREIETHLIQAVSTVWPPKGTRYTPDSVVYSDLSLETLYGRLVLLLEWFPASMEYKRMKQLVVELELVQITMDRVWFLYSSQSV